MSQTPAAAKPPRIAAADGVRGSAILGIVSLHLLLTSGSAWGNSAGAKGVITWAVLGNVIDFFFILSGFLLFLPIVGRGGIGNLREYVVGRVARIAPGYWLALLIVFVLVTWLSESPYLVSPSGLSVFVNLLGLQMPARMFDPSISVGFGLDGALWMISIIVGFYFVLPFIARAYVRHPFVGLAIAAAITIGWKELALHPGGILDSLSNGTSPSSDLPLIAVDQLPGWAFSFGLGMTGAWVYRQVSFERIRSVVCSPWFIVPAVLIYAATSLRYGKLAAEEQSISAGSETRLHTFLMIGSSSSRAAVMAVVLVGPAWARKPFESRILGRAGDLSYGVYLIHLAVAYYAFRLLGLPTDGSLTTTATWFVIVLPIAFAYSWLTLTFLERPILRMATAWAKQSPPQVIARPDPATR